MSKDRHSEGLDARPLDDGLAGTGPGIPDEARGPGEDLPEPPDDQEVERIARAIGATDKLRQAREG